MAAQGDGATLKSWLSREARAAGFDLFGVARAGKTPGAEGLRRQVALGWHGRMGHLDRNLEVRCDPRAGFPWVSTVACLGRGCGSPRSGMPKAVARYSRCRDYHDTIGGDLRALVRKFRRDFPSAGRARAFVDAGPVAEKAWAMQAGLGFQGGNTLLIAPGLGSRIHLGVLLLEAELPPDAPAAGQCGDCRRCLDACPTGALVEPGRLDARRCIAYLTVELKGEIAAEDWPKVRNWAFGCDACQDVCPFNRRAGDGNETDDAGASGPGADLADLIEMTEEGFDAAFGDTPVRRATWIGLRLNAITAAANAEDDASSEPPVARSPAGERGQSKAPGGREGGERVSPALRRSLNDANAEIRSRAQWALERLGRRGR